MGQGCSKEAPVKPAPKPKPAAKKSASEPTATTLIQKVPKRVERELLTPGAKRPGHTFVRHPGKGDLSPATRKANFKAGKDPTPEALALRNKVPLGFSPRDVFVENVPRPSVKATVRTADSPNCGFSLAYDGTYVYEAYLNGATNRVRCRVLNASTWQAGQDAGSSELISDHGPSITSWGGGRIDIVADDSTNNEVWQCHWYQATWSSWTNLGGYAKYQASVCSWGSGRLDVFAIGSDNHAYHKAYASSSWGSWADMGGSWGAAYMAFSPGSTWIYGVCRSSSNSTLYWQTYDGTDWSSMEQVEDTTMLGTPQLAARDTDYLDMVPIQSGNAYAYSYTWLISYWATQAITEFTCGPGSASVWKTADDQMYVHVWDTASPANIRENIWDGTNWGGWTTQNF